MTIAAQIAQRAQQIDGIATRILALVEEAAPAASPGADLGAEALLAALVRRLGPVDYAAFSAAVMPASKAR